MIALLAAGSSPIAIVRTTPEFHNLKDDILATGGTLLSLHAVIVVGAAEVAVAATPSLDPGDVVLLVQNSWGTDWGDQGYGLIGPKAWGSMALAVALLTAR
jgi:C1A family cysteine protease